MTYSIGTPFKDSLTEEQKRIKKESSEKRRKIFYLGVLYGSIFTYLLNPLEKCMTKN